MADKRRRTRKLSRDPDIVEEEVKQVFEETQQAPLADNVLLQELGEYKAESPDLSGGDLDADWKRADSVGEEAVGGSVPTPDQDVVDELGAAVGVTYQDDEPLHIADKLEARDRQRWDLDPASDPEYARRSREEFKDE